MIAHKPVQTDKPVVLDDCLITGSELAPTYKKAYGEARDWNTNPNPSPGLRSRVKNTDPEFRLMPWSMPHMIDWLCDIPFASPHWQRPYATVSEEIYGRVKIGNTRYDAVVVIHGGGVLSNYGKIRKPDIGYDGFSILDRDLEELTKGRASGSNGIRFYNIEEFMSQDEINDRRYAIILPLEYAYKNKSHLMSLPLFYTDPLFIARAGSLARTRKLLQKVHDFYVQKDVDPEEIKFGNFHIFNTIGLEQPQARFLHMSKMNGCPGLWDYTPHGQKKSEYNIYLVQLPTASYPSQKPDEILATFRKALVPPAKPKAEKPVPHQRAQHAQPKRVQAPPVQADPQCSIIPGVGFVRNLDFQDSQDATVIVQSPAPQRTRKHDDAQPKPGSRVVVDMDDIFRDMRRHHGQ